MRAAARGPLSPPGAGRARGSLGQANRSRPGPAEATDVFSFGCCLYEMVAGHPPWSGVSLMAVGVRVCNGERCPLSENMPAPLESLVHRCWDATASARVTVADCLAELTRYWRALRRCADQGGPIDLPPPDVGDAMLPGSSPPTSSMVEASAGRGAGLGLYAVTVDNNEAEGAAGSQW